MKLNKNRTRKFILPALLLVAALLGNLIIPASQATMMTPSAAATTGGTVVAWGDNEYGQVTIPAGLSGVTAISAGFYHNLALKSDGTVVGWGDNCCGQLDIPAQAQSGVTAISAGFDYSLALKSDGTVVGWGRNDYGQVNIPAGLSGVTAIAAGVYHSLALTPTPPNSAPVAVSKNITVSAGANCTATVTAAQVNNGSYDPDGDQITLSLNSTGPFGLGANTVMLTVTDSNGASSSATATVTVVDTTAPSLTLKPAISYWPPDGAYRTVTMSQMVASVSDGCNTSLGLNDVRIEKVTSDEPDDVKGGSDGNTTNDIVIAADCKSAQLRAERDEKKNGRVYAITLRVRDTSGNTTRKEFKVSVPKSQNSSPATQDAAAQTKTSGCP
jgi:hypothetical protein